MHQLLDRVRMEIATTGTGSTLVLGPVVPGFRSLVEAGVDETRDVPYLIEQGFQWEIVSGRYTGASNSITRVTKASSQGGTTPIDLDGTAQLFVSPMVATLLGPQTVGIPAHAMTGVDSKAPMLLREETGTNANMVLGWRFAQSVDRFVQALVPMPQSWNLGTLTARLRLRAPVENTGTCRFQMRTVALKQDTPADIAFGTPVQVDTVVPATPGRDFFTAISPAITAGNMPAHPCDLLLEIGRLGASESGGPAGVVDLLSARIDYVTNSVTDSP